jgi:hypothetical protein
MRKGSCSPSGCRSSANDTCDQSWPGMPGTATDGDPTAAMHSARLSPTTLSAALPGSGSSAACSRRSHQRIRASRIEALVEMGGRILEPPGDGWSGCSRTQLDFMGHDPNLRRAARHTPGLWTPHGQNALFTRREMEKAGHCISGYSDGQGWAPCKTVA